MLRRTYGRFQFRALLASVTVSGTRCRKHSKCHSCPTGYSRPLWSCSSSHVSTQFPAVYRSGGTCNTDELGRLLCAVSPANWPLAIPWLTVELGQSAPTYRHAFLYSKERVNKARDRGAVENNCKALWSCADRILSSNARGVVYFACLSGRSYLT